MVLLYIVIHSNNEFIFFFFFKKNLSDICISKKKVFPYEQKLFTKEELFEHNNIGDFDNKSFKGHPQCGFCSKRFYDNDDLIDHCKKNYEECQVCKQLNKPNQYFVNYKTLVYIYYII